MTVGYFVTGTDTEVGKTLVSCALLLHLREKHTRVVGMKPVAAGTVQTAEGEDNEDALSLRACGSIRVPRELDNPYCLPLPLSPHLAARAAGQHIELEVLVERYRRLAAQADAVVVEGAGGFHVPLNDTQTGADLAQALQLPVLLVVGMRLGCLNHALLTAEAVRARGLTLAAWVANTVDERQPHVTDNLQALQRGLQAPCLGHVPRLAHADHATMARHLSLEPLLGHLPA